ncbi:MAG TPA: Crp/Fnr family transcriptional regulator [Nitrosomonas sp.]|uniref:Crp/Fnr family transcriptional regulator n=1 Tax=Nitrosomonas sp. TaxID=42353 RepID=UPI000E8986DB|nr:Crp/Fnr family transcriptional regulator [Nitrosomonas sp.]GJL76013.1 MAG: cyclic nucleotide-binding protein [Nitrosomonas sp.]HBV20879.1 Crp/Fnr family transcriptional regulator [Nitrosomonas sp.]HNP26529.1 Crp/Fnr family transcriptional regulator [Nitrosomonas sp.]
MPITRQISVERACAMLSTIKEFQTLSSPDLVEIASACHWHRCDEDEEIIRFHDQSNSVFFIAQGEIRVTYHSLSGHEVILCDLASGEMFGELTAIDGKSRSATVLAKTSALLASMTAVNFMNIIFSNRYVAEAILKRLVSEVRRLTERVYDFSTLAVSNRIQAELLRIAKKNMTGPNTAFISPAPTHFDIANLVSTHREAVTRELSSLSKNKIVLREGHDLHILDIEKLTNMVNMVRGSI